MSRSSTPRRWGCKVAAIDIAEDKLKLARETGADLAVNALRGRMRWTKVLAATGGGAHGVLVTAVSTAAFAQALKMVRRKGTVSLVGLPPGEFPTPIFDVVLKRITVRGSIVGTRRDLDEAIAFAADGKVKAEVAKVPLARDQQRLRPDEGRQDRRPHGARLRLAPHAGGMPSNFGRLRIEVIPVVSARRVGHHLRLVAGGLVEACGADGEDVGHCGEGHVDRQAA